ncbi:MAG: PDZ domain-containing protein [Gemmatimonadales bacterium]
MIKVAAVHPGSIADELGLQPGAELLSVNGTELEDFLDWEFHTAEEEFTLHVRQPDGSEFEFEIERDLEDPLGVTLEPPRIRRCANRCDFCFVDGNPDGLREVLYIRDDDYRLSFRYGNFATSRISSHGTWTDHRLSAVAALRIGPRHRPGGPPLSAPEPLAPRSSRSSGTSPTTGSSSTPRS